MDKESSKKDWKFDACAAYAAEIQVRKCVLCPKSSGALKNGNITQYSNKTKKKEKFSNEWAHITCTMVSPIGLFTGIGKVGAINVPRGGGDTYVSKNKAVLYGLYIFSPHKRS